MGSQSVMGYVGTRLSSIWRKRISRPSGDQKKLLRTESSSDVKPVNFAVQDVIFFALFSIFIFALIFFLVEQRMFTFFVGNGMEHRDCACAQRLGVCRRAKISGPRWHREMR